MIFQLYVHVVYIYILLMQYNIGAVIWALFLTTYIPDSLTDRNAGFLCQNIPIYVYKYT